MAFTEAERVAAKNRTLLSERQKQVSTSLVYGYRLAHERLLDDLDVFYREVDSLSTTPSRAWINDNATLQRAFTRYNSSLLALGVETNRVAYNAAAEAAAKGASTGADMLVALSSVTRAAPMRAPTDFVNDRLTQGLDATISARAGAQSDTVKRILVDSVANGDDPYRTARKIRKTADGFQGALTVVRTEQLNSYRASNIYAFREGGDVEFWMWSSRKSSRTCASCWGLDGQVFPVTSQMNSHPNCMCVPVPVLGDEDDARQVTGPEAFEKLPERTRKQILGPTANLAYSKGEVALSDLVGKVRKRGYPDSYGTKSLQNVLGKERVLELKRELHG